MDDHQHHLVLVRGAASCSCLRLPRLGSGDRGRRAPGAPVPHPVGQGGAAGGAVGPHQHGVARLRLVGDIHRPPERSRSPGSGRRGARPRRSRPTCPPRSTRRSSPRPPGPRCASSKRHPASPATAPAGPPTATRRTTLRSTPGRGARCCRCASEMAVPSPAEAGGSASLSGITQGTTVTADRKNEVSTSARRWRGLAAARRRACTARTKDGGRARRIRMRSLSAGAARREGMVRRRTR